MPKKLTVVALTLLLGGAAALALRWAQAVPEAAAIEQVSYQYDRRYSPAYSTRTSTEIAGRHNRVSTTTRDGEHTLVRYNTRAEGRTVWTNPSKGIKTTMGQPKIDSPYVNPDTCDGKRSKTIHGYQSYEVSVEQQDGRGVYRLIHYRVPEFGCMDLAMAHTFTDVNGELVMLGATFTTDIDHRVEEEDFMVPSSLKEMQLGDFFEILAEHREDFETWKEQNVQKRREMNHAYRRNHLEHDIRSPDEDTW